MNTRSIPAAFFRQSVPAIGLSLERATERTPSVGHFYVFLGEEIRGKFRNKKHAVDLYSALLKDSGFTPPPSETKASRNEIVERYLDDLESYWGASHKHARRGGKGRF